MTGYICKYAPAAILAGFGAEPALLNPSAGSFELSDALTHQNLCSFSKSLICAVMRGEVRELVLTSCCDSIRRAYDVIRRYGTLDYLYLLDFPHCNTGCAAELYARELQAFAEDYAGYCGRAFDLEACVSSIKPSGPEPSAGKLSVAGARISRELLDQVEERFPGRVRNDTCTAGARLGAVPEGLDEAGFFRWYAGALLGQEGCMRMAQPGLRRSLSEAPGLSGVIYHTVKFCDFYGFDYIGLQKRLSAPMTKVETDYTLQSLGQLGTRLEAFGESVGIQAGEVQKVQLQEGQYVAGIDSGSTSTNAVILDRRGALAGQAVVPTGARAKESARAALEQALEQAGIGAGDIVHTVSTGYGRTGIGQGDAQVTEITCHAKGAYHADPQVRTIIDIGGQDCKVIRLDDNGNVETFAMNDKCAAGTGRFLEMMAATLGLRVEEMGRAGLEWREDIGISSMCTVFAESEVVSLVAQNKRTADIVHGLNCSVASRIGALAGRTGGQAPYMMTGGVAANPGVVQAIEEKLGEALRIPPHPQLCGALGAALIALEQCGEAR
ncbi:MAG: acyl-CoA dehydratase activase [Clostridiales bacterium]|nr:acyl-CoA dehydratase activase [Clostridiales bacterium]